MRVIDKLKKKLVIGNTKTLAEAQPLCLKLEDGEDIKVFFGGICFVKDKPLHNALIEYKLDEDKVEKRKVLIEPVMRIHDDGTIEDKTEKYFKQILDSANMADDRAIYMALMKFFGNKESSEKELKSDYIGFLAQYDNGTYYRFFDDDFRKQYVREKIDAKYFN